MAKYLSLVLAGLTAVVAARTASFHEGQLCASLQR
jgi:hypothetical protein